MMTVLTIVQVLIAMAMIGIILVQRGPGAAAGSGFGAGASATVFGARGSGSFLTRTTAVLATAFFGISLLMAVLVSGTVDSSGEVDLGVMADAPAPAAEEAPAPGAAFETLDSDVPTLDEEGVPATDVPLVPAEREDDGSGS